MKVLLNELNHNDFIRTRLGYGGTRAELKYIEGRISNISPFQSFKMIWL